jgi:hypothetical protein
MNVRRRPAVCESGLDGADGFRRIARRTGITATKVHIRAGEVRTTEARVRPGLGTARMGRLFLGWMGQSLPEPEKARGPWSDTASPTPAEIGSPLINRLLWGQIRSTPEAAPDGRLTPKVAVRGIAATSRARRNFSRRSRAAELA